MRNIGTYTRYRHEIGFHRNKEYLSFCKKRFPNLELHHILGSTIGKKHTDYLLCPYDKGKHIIAHKYPGDNIEVEIIVAITLLEIFLDHKGIDCAGWFTDLSPEVLAKTLDRVHIEIS